MKGSDLFHHETMAPIFQHNDSNLPELDTINYIKKHLSDKSKNFVDIGAHIGTFSCDLSDSFDKIYAFEPCLMHYHYLCANLTKHCSPKKYSVKSFAIGEENTKSKFYIREKIGGTNGLELNFDNGEPVLGEDLPSYSVEVRKLDYFNISNIGLIKIDVEGYEPDVINGALNTLKKNNYPPIIFEVNELMSCNPRYKGLSQEDAEKNFYNFLKNLGYKVFKLKDTPWLNNGQEAICKTILAKKDNSLLGLLNHYIKHPEDQYNKFWLGQKYAEIGHWSSAMGYFLSAAEFTDDDDLAYECLIKKALGYSTLKHREAHYKNSCLLAIGLRPERPEGYFALCVYYSTSSSIRDEDRWQQIYCWAQNGKILAKNYNGPELMTDIGYHKEFIFDYYIALSLWWTGQFEKSLQTFHELLDNPNLDEDYTFKCKKVLENFGNKHVRLNV